MTPYVVFIGVFISLEFSSLWFNYIEIRTLQSPVFQKLRIRVNNKPLCRTWCVARNQFRLKYSNSFGDCQKIKRCNLIVLVAWGSINYYQFYTTNQFSIPLYYVCTNRFMAHISFSFSNGLLTYSLALWWNNILRPSLKITFCNFRVSFVMYCFSHMNLLFRYFWLILFLLL